MTLKFEEKKAELLELSTEEIRAIAKDLSIPVCDLREGFLTYLKTNNPTNAEKEILTSDRVHLNNKGNLFVATQMWPVLQPMIK